MYKFLVLFLINKKGSWVKQYKGDDYDEQRRGN